MEYVSFKGTEAEYKSGSHRHKINKDVHYVTVFPIDTGVRVKEHNGTYHAGQNGQKFNTDKIILLFSQNKVFGNGCEEDGEKDQFQMLPCGFIDRKKEPRHGVFPTPVINKVENSSQKTGNKEANEFGLFE